MRLILIAGALSFLCACAYSQESKKDDREWIREEVRKVFQEEKEKFARELHEHLKKAAERFMHEVDKKLEDAGGSFHGFEGHKKHGFKPHIKHQKMLKQVPQRLHAKLRQLELRISRIEKVLKHARKMIAKRLMKSHDKKWFKGMKKRGGCCPECPRKGRGFKRHNPGGEEHWFRFRGPDREEGCCRDNPGRKDRRFRFTPQDWEEDEYQERFMVPEDEMFEFNAPKFRHKLYVIPEDESWY